MNPRRQPKSRSRKLQRRARNEPRRETQEKARAQDADSGRRIARVNFFWTDCTNPACRRERKCAGDAIACVERRFEAMPEWQRRWRLDFMDELYRTKDFETARAYATARAAERQRMAEQHAAASAANRDRA
jgi:hypothetical protein